MELSRAIDNQIKLELEFIQVMKQEFQRIREALDECVRRHPTDDAVAQLKGSIDTILDIPVPDPTLSMRLDNAIDEQIKLEIAFIDAMKQEFRRIREALDDCVQRHPTEPVVADLDKTIHTIFNTPVPAPSAPAKIRPAPPTTPPPRAPMQYASRGFFGFSHGGTRRLKRKRTRRLPKHTK